jgi:two-component system, response regulator
MSRRQPRNILLVEDNPDDVELTIVGLERHHLANRLVVAGDGAEALDLLIGEHATPFAFVMLNLKMPKVSGQEVLERVRADARTRILPVIVLTSSSQEEDMIDSYNNGANSYIRKPLDFNEFVNAVAELGLYWAVLNESRNGAAYPPRPVRCDHRGTHRRG